MLTILYILLIFVFLIIIKQFYFNTSEKFHVEPEQQAHDHDEDGNDQSVDGGSNRNDNVNANANLGSGGSPVRENAEETTDDSTAETTRASEQTNETTNAVESSSPSDTTQVSIVNQPPEEQDQPSDEQGSSEPLTEEQLLRLLIQERRDAVERIQQEQEDSTRPVITARVDSNCCGLNIYNNELMNINKCLEQHLDKTTHNGYEYITDNWKSTQDSSCKNPPHILAKTTNCSGNNSVIGKFFPHIKTLYDIVESTKAEGCPYRASKSYRPSPDELEHLRESTSNPLNDFDMASIFFRNIDCQHRQLGNTLGRSSTSLARTNQPIRRCGGLGQD